MTIEERLTALEKELARAKHFNRRLLAVLPVIVAACLVAGAFLIGTSVNAQVQGITFPELRANSFVLVDEKSITRASLELRNGEAGLTLWAENGKPCVSLLGLKDGPSLWLIDENGQIRASLDAAKDRPSLSLSDGKGKTRVSLATTEEMPSLSLSDAKGNIRALMYSGEHGPRLNLFDANDESRVILATTEDGPNLSLRDEEGKARAVLGIYKTETPDGKIISYPESSVLLFGPDSKLRWTAP